MSSSAVRPGQRRAGGVDGLLAVSIDGVFFIPFYDHNGNIVGYVSEAGTIAAQYLYEPYGNIIDQYGTQPDQFYFGFSTKYHDRKISMIGYQRRFYRPDLGRWLNRDPIEEEGGENLYEFCMNSPMSNLDVNGCWAFVDNAIAAVCGALVGVACQTYADLIKREVSDWESYVGSAVSGAVMGEILLHNPAMAGMTKVMYSGIAAAVGNVVRQLCSVEVSKKQKDFNTQEFFVDVAAGMAFSIVPSMGVSKLNKGSGSCLSIARSMNKKFINGSVSHSTVKTTVKSFGGAAWEYGMQYGGCATLVSEGVNQGINMFLDGMTPAENEFQVNYREEMFISVKDKCGNSVIFNYMQEVISYGQ